MVFCIDVDFSPPVRYDDTSVYNNYVGYNEISFIGLGLLSDMGCVYT
jgi:hypothetical protein